MENAKISEKDVRHVAKLARLALSDEEVKDFTHKFQAILDHGNDLTSLDLTDVPPTFRPIALSNVMREDTVESCIARDEVLKCAPAKSGDRFLVPPMLSTD